MESLKVIKPCRNDILTISCTIPTYCAIFVLKCCSYSTLFGCFLKPYILYSACQVSIQNISLMDVYSTSNFFFGLYICKWIVVFLIFWPSQCITSNPNPFAFSYRDPQAHIAHNVLISFRYNISQYEFKSKQLIYNNKAIRK